MEDGNAQNTHSGEQSESYQGGKYAIHRHLRENLQLRVNLPRQALEDSRLVAEALEGTDEAIHQPAEAGKAAVAAFDLLEGVEGVLQSFAGLRSGVARQSFQMKVLLRRGESAKHDWITS